jgi:hypothetical protein
MDKKLFSEFMTPAAANRPQPFWSLNDKLTEAEMFRQIDEMSAQGYGGFFMHSRVGLVTGYLSEEWMRLNKACALYARERGLQAWLYDEDMWPSGYASGVVTKRNPAFRLKSLVRLEGETPAAGDAVISVSGGVTYAVRVMPDTARFNGGAYIDTLNPDAVGSFLEATHEKYAKYMGELFGGAIKGIFTDEPCYAIEFFGAAPHVPYSENLFREFKLVRGYDVADRLEELFVDCGEFRRTRYDYYSLCAGLFRRNYAAQYADWCKKHNLKFVGHFGCEDSLKEQIWAQGAVMPLYKYLDVPGADKLMRPNAQLSAIKQVVSAAAQLNKPFSLCECFAGRGQDCGISGRKRISDWLAALGISFFNAHLFPYSIRGERKRDYPPALSPHQPWWRDERKYSDYLGRLSMLNERSREAAPVLLLQPMAEAYSLYKPQAAPELDELDAKFAGLSLEFTRNAIGYHYGDDDLIREFGRAEGESFWVGEACYEHVVIPFCGYMAPDTADKLAAFSAGGGKVYAVGRAPEHCFGREKLPEILFESVFAGAREAAEFFREVSGIPVTGGDSVTASVRKTEAGHIVFLCNASEREAHSVKFGAGRKGVLEIEGKVYIVSAMTGEVFFAAESLEALPEIKLLPCGSLTLFAGEAERVFNSVKNCPPPFTEDGAILAELKEAGRADFRFVRAESENVLPLCYADFQAGNGETEKNLHVSQIWHERFYPLADETPFCMEYFFEAESVPEGKVFAVIENAENLERITVNGVTVVPLRKRGEAQLRDDKCYLDASFTKTDIGGYVRPGKNSLLIQGRKCSNITGICMHRPVVPGEPHFATEAETAYITGGFDLAAVSGGGYAIAKSGSCENKGMAGYPFYCGSAVFAAEVFAGEGEAPYLAFEGGGFATMELFADGVSLGKRVTAPYLYELKGLRGRVKLEARITGTLFGLTGPHGIRGYAGLKWVDPGLFNDQALRTDDAVPVEMKIGEAILLCD